MTFSVIWKTQPKRKKLPDWQKKEKSLQHTMIAIKNKFGKNAILKAANLKEEARTIARNSEIGGHKA